MDECRECGAYLAEAARGLRAALGAGAPGGLARLVSDAERLGAGMDCQVYRSLRESMFFDRLLAEAAKWFRRYWRRPRVAYWIGELKAALAYCINPQSTRSMLRDLAEWYG